MIERKMIRRRKLIAGCGIMDSIISYSKDGLHEVRKHFVHGVKHYVKAGSAHGTQFLANRAHELIHHVQHASNDKIARFVGSGIKQPEHSNRELILREIQQSLNGGSIHKQKGKRRIV